MSRSKSLIDLYEDEFEGEMEPGEGEGEEELSICDRFEDEEEQTEEDEDFLPGWANEEEWEAAKKLSIEHKEELDFNFMVWCIASGLCKPEEPEMPNDDGGEVPAEVNPELKVELE